VVSNGTENSNRELSGLKEILGQIIAGKLPDSLPEDVFCRDELLAILANFRELSDFVLSLSNGQLDRKLSLRGPMAGSLKSLQASLRHLSWQTKMVASGDFSQRVDFMGDFSSSFNTMVENLAQNREELRQKNAELEKLNNAQENLLVIVAHDLRSPISGIKISAEYLLESGNDSLNEEQREFLQLIQSTAESQLQLISSLLSGSNIKGKAENLVYTSFHLRPLVEHIYSNVYPVCQQKKIEFMNEVDYAVVLHADKQKIEQIMMNLVGNAVKFTDNGRIRVCAQVRSDETLISVLDSGQGISESDQALLFTAGFSREGSRGEKGTGVGLPHVKKMVNLHSGRIWAESKISEGTGIYFTIPNKKN
jgi:signal transduction histidine kinase